MKDAVRDAESRSPARAAGGSGRVGGRQAEPGSPLGGGGYQDICSKKTGPFKKKCDPRLNELRLVGLPKPWMTIAENVGVDTFLEIWRTLDQHIAGSCADRYLHVPSFRSYLRFQRNRFIATLGGQRRSTDEIKRRVRTDLQEEIGQRHINRILARQRASGE